MNDVALGAEEVAVKEFPVAFRGFAQHEVRAFLAQVAAELAATRERERLQRERLEAAESRADRPLTDEEIEVALGHEAGRVLQAAREAAAEIRSRAEEQVARLVRDASGEGSRAHLEAESLLALRTEEAERISVEIQAQAQTAAEDVLEEAKARGREMVAEAQAVRERVLKDLARRRRVAHQQLEQLRAGRERLLEAYRVVRTTLDEATRELSVAEAEARAAAETAALRAGSQREPTVEELEAELVGARDIGLAPASTFVAPAPEAEALVVEPMTGVGWSRQRLSTPEAAPSAPEPVPVPAPAPAPDVPPTGVSEVAEPEPDVSESDVPAMVEAEAEMLPAETSEPDASQPEPESSEPAPDMKEMEPETSEPDASERMAGAAQPDPVASAGHEVDDQPPDVDPATAEPATVETATDEPATFEGQNPRRVEDLFARLRAERAASVARAEDVLATPPPPSPISDAVASTNGHAPSPAAEVAPPTSEPTTDDEDLLQARDAELEEVERSLIKALKRALVDEQNEVLDVLRRKGAGVPLVELLPGASDHTARYLAAVGPELRAAAAQGTGAGHDPPSVDELAVGLAAEVTGDLRARLQRALEAADGDVAPMVDGISSAYREWKTTKAEPLARHHASAAHSRGRFASAPPGKLRWVVDGEEGPCPDCDDNALAGAIGRGESFPTGQPYPPAHVGCRCTIAVEPR